MDIIDWNLMLWLVNVMQNKVWNNLIFERSFVENKNLKVCDEKTIHGKTKLDLFK